MRLPLVRCAFLVGTTLAAPAWAEGVPGAPGGVTAGTGRCEEVRRGARYRLSLEKVALEELVQMASNATCKTFILPEGVQGRISIVAPARGRAEVSAEEFYAAFLAALDAHGLAVQPAGSFLRVVPKAAARRGPIPTILPPEPR